MCVCVCGWVCVCVHVCVCVCVGDLVLLEHAVRIDSVQLGNILVAIRPIRSDSRIDSQIRTDAIRDLSRDVPWHFCFLSWWRRTLDGVQKKKTDSRIFWPRFPNRHKSGKKPDSHERITTLLFWCLISLIVMMIFFPGHRPPPPRKKTKMSRDIPREVPYGIR